MREGLLWDEVVMGSEDPVGERDGVVPGELEAVLGLLDSPPVKSIQQSIEVQLLSSGSRLLQPVVSGSTAACWLWVG